MSILSGLMSNRVVMNSLLGQLKSVIRDNELECIVVKLDRENDDLLIQMYKPGECVITLPEGTQESPEIVNPENVFKDADNTDNA